MGALMLSKQPTIFVRPSGYKCMGVVRFFRLDTFFDFPFLRFLASTVRFGISNGSHSVFTNSASNDGADLAVNTWPSRILTRRIGICLRRVQRKITHDQQ
jgi:hypothetical protein